MPVLIALALLAAADPVSPPEAAIVDTPVAVRGPTDDARATAATAAGVSAFVGIALGGVLVPGTLAVVANQLGGPAALDALAVAGVAGGAVGAAIGGSIGAATTTVWWGIPLVGLAAAGGSLIGLVPAALLNSAATAAADPNPNTPIRLAAAGCLVVAMGAGPLSAAGAAALLARPPDEAP